MSIVSLAITTCAIYCGLFLVAGAVLSIYLLRGGVVGFVRPQTWRDAWPYARLFGLLWLISYGLAFTILSHRFGANIKL